MICSLVPDIVKLICPTTVISMVKKGVDTLITKTEESKEMCTKLSLCQINWDYYKDELSINLDEKYNLCILYITHIFLQEWS